MASWSEVVAFSQPLTSDRTYRGAEDFEVTFRVMGLVPLLVWDAGRQERRVIAARWGFPHPDDWRRPQTIHARAETIDTTRAFADAFRGGQRGIVLVKTFNEAPDSGEQHVFEPDAMKTGIAFVWRRFDVGAAAPLIACVMVTVAANEMIATLPADRMPAILASGDWTKWTGEEPASAAELKAMLKTREGVNWKMRREYRAKATVREP
ncbi:MAG TPA: SOS response-associated peptidase family protein, partial [Rhizomicrobium sp.]